MTTNIMDITSGILIHLDDLLDTRLAILQTLIPDYDFLKERIRGIPYHHRTIDSFKHIDNMTFYEAYSKRDKSILLNATATMVLDQVRDFVFETIRLDNDGPFKIKPKVFLNTFPYVLTDDESSIFLRLIANITKGRCDVEIIRMGYEELTPSFLKKEISTITMYDPFNWLEIHSVLKTFESEACPEISLLAPAILHNLDTPKDVKTMLDTLGIDKYIATEMLAERTINLKFVDTALFSTVVGNPLLKARTNQKP